MGFPGDSDGKESAYNVGDPGSIPGSGRSPGEGNGNLPVFLSGEFHGQKSLAGYNPWGHKESDVTNTFTISIYTVRSSNSIINGCLRVHEEPQLPEPSRRRVPSQDHQVSVPGDISEQATSARATSIHFDSQP